MSVFRPSARVHDPGGREWEIYAYRIALPGRLTGRFRRLRRLGRFVTGAVRALQSDAWTVQAVSWAPFRSTYTWRTTREHRGQVLAQVEGGLARGELPRPRRAQYLGADRY